MSPEQERGDDPEIASAAGLRISKPILEQCGFGSEVELRVEPGRLVVLPVAAARAGWEEAFARAGGDQALLLPDGMSSEFDDAEWTW
jgi:antitoxin MazE